MTPPKERPILFSSSMVRAILDGSKTQTRRVMKPQPPNWPWHRVEVVAKVYGFTQRIGDKDYWIKPCPYGQPGDRLCPAMPIPSLNRNYCADVYGRIWSRARDGETWEHTGRNARRSLLQGVAVGT